MAGLNASDAEISAPVPSVKSSAAPVGPVLEKEMPVALALIGQAVVRMALTDATDAPTNLFWSGIAIAVTMMLISFILYIIEAVREAGRARR